MAFGLSFRLVRVRFSALGVGFKEKGLGEAHFGLALRWQFASRGVTGIGVFWGMYFYARPLKVLSPWN